jgi:hypothetical protein
LLQNGGGFFFQMQKNKVNSTSIMLYIFLL